jgi:hypothetical protein
MLEIVIAKKVASARREKTIERAESDAQSVDRVTACDE